MTAKKGWEKSSSGPDWVDLEMLMRAMEGLHSAHVALIVSPAGIGFSGGVRVAASAIFENLPGSALPSTVSLTKNWPCTSHSTIAAHCFALLHELDYKIGQTYKNEALWK